MEKYFYVKNYVYDPTNTRIIRLAGYYTDVRHDLFFPDFGISRAEAIKMLKSGEVLFLEDGCYRRVKIKLIKIDRQEYMRVDYQAHPQDYLG